MKEIVIISGKGGTGKTSIAASFAALAAGEVVLADCDVDAADLHLILKPRVRTRSDFSSGHTARVRTERCTGCGTCVEVCRFDAISKERRTEAVESGVHYTIDPVGCEGCGTCVRFCPADAIAFPEEKCGEWFVSDTRFGPMVHARLGIAAENSGKLVTLVRTEAKRIAEKQSARYLLIDGSPGIGCPVIASLTAAHGALIVTEPTVSGAHDLGRIARLTKRLGVPAMVCINKWDINPPAAEGIEKIAAEEGLTYAGAVRYDAVSKKAQQAEKAITEYCEDGIATDISRLWERVKRRVR
jgi:MinD superfamily P-loop ATPase